MTSDATGDARADARDHARDDASDRLDLEQLLVATSRTFALAIPLLPEPIRLQVGIAYLLFRIAEDDWDQVLDTNLKGAFLMTKLAARGMIKRRWGRVISITSVVGLTGNKGQSNYAASKAGLIGFTKTVAKELASRNVLVNAVAPGYIDTEMTRGIAEEAKQALQAAIPLGRSPA